MLKLKSKWNIFRDCINIVFILQTKITLIHGRWLLN